VHRVKIGFLREGAFQGTRNAESRQTDAHAPIAGMITDLRLEATAAAFDSPR
jgi:hypothetical protein